MRYTNVYGNKSIFYGHDVYYYIIHASSLHSRTTAISTTDSRSGRRNHLMLQLNELSGNGGIGTYSNAIASGHRLNRSLSIHLLLTQSTCDTVELLTAVGQKLKNRILTFSSRPPCSAFNTPFREYSAPPPSPYTLDASDLPCLARFFCFPLLFSQESATGVTLQRFLERR